MNSISESKQRSVKRATSEIQLEDKVKAYLEGTGFEDVACNQVGWDALQYLFV
jgi:hypothetical protein